MHWPPYFLLDLTAHGLLPLDLAAQLRAATEAPERLTVQTGAEPMPGDEQFSILPGPAVRTRFEWLWDLYHRPLRDFVGECFGRPVFAANRVSSAITLNILEGAGAGHDWHTDANMVTGVLFGTTLEEGDGGELEFRRGDGEVARLRPRAGTFVCFPGAVQHRVAAMQAPRQRLSFPMIYYDSVEDQPFASADDRYEPSPA